MPYKKPSKMKVKPKPAAKKGYSSPKRPKAKSKTKKY
tara:strand:+ start:320 stop:430 length:111 start_codon:yes stop_codon:yes gene_type:complete